MARVEAFAGRTRGWSHEPQQDVPDPRRHTGGTPIAARGAIGWLTLLRSVANRGQSSIPATTSANGTNPMPMPSAMPAHVASAGVMNHQTAAGAHAASSGFSQLATK